MSRIGKKHVPIPQGVEAVCADGVLTIKGPKGTLSRPIHGFVTCTIADGTITMSVKKEDNKQQRSLWGTFSSHAANMVQGVTEGFKKQLEINGVGYKVAMQGKTLKVDAGYSHPVMYEPKEGVVISTEKNIVTIEGANKEDIGQAAAEIRKIRKPEPYKGKGIKYIDEIIRRKAGKSAKAA